MEARAPLSLSSKRERGCGLHACDLLVNRGRKAQNEPRARFSLYENPGGETTWYGGVPGGQTGPTEIIPWRVFGAIASEAVVTRGKASGERDLEPALLKVRANPMGNHVADRSAHTARVSEGRIWRSVRKCTDRDLVHVVFREKKASCANGARTEWLSLTLVRLCEKTLEV